MPRKRPDQSTLANDLQTLNQQIPQSLVLPSLNAEPARVQGHAYRFFLVLPLYSDDGRPVFTDAHLTQLFAFFTSRFGGLLASSARSGAPYFGEYQPAGTNPVRDYHTVVSVYANPIEPSDRFFRELKAILRKAPLIKQDEILIERSEVYLV